MKKTDTERKSSTDSTESSAHSSNAQVNSYKQQSILVNYDLDRNSLSVNFSVNSGQRADTEVTGGGQGDRTTAYEVILQAILSSTDFIGISGAIYQSKNLLMLFTFVFLVKIKTLKTSSMSLYSRFLKF